MIILKQYSSKVEKSKGTSFGNSHSFGKTIRLWVERHDSSDVCVCVWEGGSLVRGEYATLILSHNAIPVQVLERHTVKSTFQKQVDSIAVDE